MSKRGGKRLGAGRPATVGASQRATITLSPDDVIFLKAISPNLSEAIRMLITQARSKE